MAAPKRKPVVSFLGPAATYSHQATAALFSEKDWDLVPVGTIKGVFDVVQGGEATYGVVPFENSTHGVVTFTLDCLGDRRDEYADVSVCGELYLDVHHALLGRTAARPGNEEPSDGSRGEAGAGQTESDKSTSSLPSLTHIQHVYSHPQGLGQTARFLAMHLPQAELVDVSSTSRAAEMAAADSEGRSAAVASELAAGPSGLDVLARCIEDRQDNTTRFFIIHRRRPGSGHNNNNNDQDATDGDQVSVHRAFRELLHSHNQQLRRSGGGGGDYNRDHPPAAATSVSNRHKSLVSFTVPHTSPGALADALECFRRHSFNLTSINSLPSLAMPFQYLFFVEFEAAAAGGDGNADDDADDDDNGDGDGDGDGMDSRPSKGVRAVLDDMRLVTESSRWLGSWESQR